MSFINNLSELLYKDIESDGATNQSAQNSTNHYVNVIGNLASTQNLGAIPRNRPSERQHHDGASCTQNRHARGNWRGRGNSRPSGNLEKPESTFPHSSARRGIGSAMKSSPSRNLEGAESTFPHSSARRGIGSAKNFRPKRNLEEPESTFTHSSGRKVDGSAKGTFYGQHPSKPVDPVHIDGNMLESLVLKREQQPQMENEDIPGLRFTQIEALLKMNPSELLMHLTVKMNDFLRLLKQKLRPDMIMLVVAMFAKISSSDMKENQASLLTHAIQPGILEQFSSHSFNIVAQNMNYSVPKIIKYFENLYTLYQDVVDIMPSKASEIFSDHSTRAVMALQNLKMLRKVTIPPKLENDYQILMASVESLLEQQKSSAPKKSRGIVLREWQPGMDFRLLSIHPLPRDLLHKPDTNLYPAVVKGPYKSVEHYLTVQFNLMREDFLIPLREGIANFVEHKSSKTNKYKRIENVRFYNDVRFLSQFVEGDVIVTEVLFNRRAKSSRHNWRRSKRLLYGSLLCFSSDLFSSIILGVVVDRRVELLEKGILRCELLGDVKEDCLFKKEFTMAESEVYFEAYQHVMRALQNFDETNFPLQEYLIHVTSDLHLPSYLVNDPYAMYKSGELEFPVLNEHFWPNMDDLKVNESQFKALHSALTKKCTVIQGPPGTGKTYLGLVIAKLLLENSIHWRRAGRGPILVVCFTNHALDQFLEGMLSFTNNIVRIGSQSKNENLNEYNLRVVRKKRGIRGIALHEIEGKLELLSKLMGHNSNFLKELTKNVGILSLEYIWHWMESFHASWFTFKGNHQDSMLVEWLLTGAYFTNLVNYDIETDDVEPISNSMIHLYTLSLQQIKLNIEQLQAEALEGNASENESIRYVMMMYISRFQYMKKKLLEPFDPDAMLIAELSMVKNLNDLHPELRWVLYKYWVSIGVEHYQKKLMDGRCQYQVLNKQKSEILESVYLETILDSDVVGLTTTGAARHQSMLQKLGSKIVIVEEAAEAMESHIVVSLSSKCEHLILIGDHKQLRPSPAVYKLAKNYHLEISLFERMLMNGVKYDTLKIQHRMRPDIADLVFPAVYPVLENHRTVMAYDSILGLRENLFFITHSHPEEMAMDDLSKRNLHEAEFLVALCRHIVLQGYDPSQITILTTYLGQMFLLCEEREKHSIIKDVRIAVVDNFQGEENDIILLSLVRNNEEKKIGFLASENRTCVALSRAKMGLYIIGNIDMLAEDNTLWFEVRRVLQDKKAVGTHLTLQCLKHPEQLTPVNKAEDFTSITEGGCRLMCGDKLNCGHICKKMCHVQGHTDYRCHENCNKVMCVRGHKCQKLCWENCGDCMVAVESILPCGHEVKLPCHVDPKEHNCLAVVSVKLPSCEHTNEKLCYVNVGEVPCSFDCDSRLPCGHVCSKKCHVNCDPEHLEYKCLRPCGRKNLECKEEHICQRKCYEECSKCTFKVKRKLPNCDHYFDMECFVDPSTYLCQKPCKNRLDCGHACPRKCKDLCGGCQVSVKKEIPDCKHKVTMKCCEVPVRKMCKADCERVRNCGHKCSGICGISCSEKNCESLSTRSSLALCGHDIRLFCHEVSSVPSPEILMKRCMETCGKTLECSHRCKGTCGQCLQGRIHIPCQEKCGRNLICGHECTVSCSQNCPPCKKNCFIHCVHSKCKNKCGKPCSPCLEKCSWQCKHQKCNKKCSDLCDRPPCNEPCEKKLVCGHNCIGFCGENCPDLCRVCNPEEVDDILTFLGTEDDENARFIVLPDCKHVFESTGLEKWLSMDSNTVKMLECPQCKTPIQKAYRFGNEAKKRFSNVLKVKLKVFGGLKKINNNVIKAAEKLMILIRSGDFVKSQRCMDELQHFVKRSKKESFGAFVLNSLEARTEFVLSIVEHFHELKSKVSPHGALEECRNAASLLIGKMLRRLEMISVQEHSDFEGECMRFHLLMNLRVLENTNGFRNFARTSWYQDYQKCQVVVEDARAFPKGRFDEVLQKINEVYKSLTTGSIGISQHEMKQVVAAVNLHQGHWYACPNGHIFVIGECGRAMETGSCNECGAPIGGSSHRLLHSNRPLNNIPTGR